MILEGLSLTNLREVGRGQGGINKGVRGKFMIILVRCMSCGKVVGHLWKEYKKRVESGEESEKVMDDLGLERYCCRALFLGHVDLIKKISKFKV